MKKIKFADVAHLYIGCKLKTKEGVGTFNVFYTPGTGTLNGYIPITCYDLVKSEWRFDQVKPLLKRLTQLTQGDANALGWADFKNLKHNFYEDPKLDEFTPIEFSYLVKNSFDLFGLIDNGQAIQDV